ncbi:yemanuclein [Arctopsyche grandis]|uniref:yemanuclein n=1 Tax=Arctopsyche grandis TaxID=121162 RepID=UPI00406D8D55
MAEQRRRVAPASAPLAPAPAASAPSAAAPAAPSAAAPRPARTLRLALHLSQSTERDCPEFNYKELIATEEGRRKAEKEKRKGNAPNGIWDGFSDNDEDVERIAKQFEQKYGSSSTYGRSKGHCKRDDYADIGAGYDENDSFIDNTDGYDEIIPPECDTACGGFYINSGSLEFKNVTGAGLSTGEGAAGDSSPPAERKSHKRLLSSSESEEESSSSCDDTEGSVVEKPIDRNVKDIKTNSVTDSDKSGEDGKQSKIVKNKENLPKKKRKNSQEGSASSGQETSNNKKSTKEIIASTPNAGIENHNEASSDSHSSPVPSSDNHASSDSSREAVSLPNTNITPIAAPANVPLPELPPELSVLVQRLKGLADSHFSSRTGKLSGPEVNDIILGMEMQCKRSKVSPVIRRDLFAYAAQLLRRGKAGLLQRARRLAEDHQRNTSSISSPMEKLKEVINKMKPSLLETYRIESQKIMEINKNIATQNATLDDDKKIQERRLPKRRFPWNDQVRSILQDVVRSRGLDASENDESAVRFLQTVVLPLFPSGFVRMPTLLQQVRNNKTQKPTDNGTKKILNKSFDAKQQVNSQLSITLKQPARNPNDAKIAEMVDKSISDPESVSMVRPKHKTQTSSICIGTDSAEQHQDSSKLTEQVSITNEPAKVIGNCDEIDKNKLFKVNSNHIPGLQTLSDNISISITSVFPKKCDSEITSASSPVPDKYTPAVDSVIIQPSDKLVQPVKPSNETIITSSNVHSVIKSVESVSPNANVPQNQVGSLKVKSQSSLFDKSTIAKIISSKTTSVDTLNKYNISDNMKSKPGVVDPPKTTDKISNKSVQDNSHSVKRLKSNNGQAFSAPSAIHSQVISSILKSANAHILKPVSVVLTDNFAKPHYKTDHLISSSKNASVLNNSNVQSKSRDASLNGSQKDGDQSPSASLNNRNHSFLKPNVTRPADFSQMASLVNDNSPSQKHQRVIKHADEPATQNFTPISPSANNDHKKNSNRNISPYQKSDSFAQVVQRNPVLNVDDSSSDDCIEVLTDDEHSSNKSILSKMIDNKASRAELIRRQVMAQCQKLAKDSKFNKNKPYSADVIKDKSKDKRVSNSVILNSHSENAVKVSAIKKLPNYGKSNDYDVKGNRYDVGMEIIEEEDPLRGVIDNVCSNLSLNSVGRGDALSVIKDIVSIKSDRIMDTVPENSAIRFEKDIGDRDIIMDQDLDVSRVMQDLKELQDLQMQSGANHQRLYDDPSNNLCHPSSFTETENKIYTKHKESRENINSINIFLESSKPQNLTTGSHQ